MKGKIFKNTNDLVAELNMVRENRPIYMTSGGFDPMHVGHLRCIQETVKMATDPVRNAFQNRGITVIVVNGDGFLNRKKGYAFMPHNERMEIIAGISGVDYVVGWDDGSQNVKGAIHAIRPTFFTKGGDRTSSQNVPEWDVCNRVECKIIFNVGGEKIQSSSKLVEKANKNE